ncbi:hypothetical protein RchiOBHm_Chr7g0193231 [Rosa chinensis]|uniref:Uncharacterized protein n=1 Tax=Rosa chinensis TaxID=74649 RepID=A0A2P6P5R8_ROSCH|nr:hypothetical protein RchiOBHm_Chr7g0193231 [Rosa chinensis]
MILKLFSIWATFNKLELLIRMLRIADDSSLSCLCQLSLPYPHLY